MIASNKLTIPSSMSDSVWLIVYISRSISQFMMTFPPFFTLVQGKKRFPVPEIWVALSGIPDIVLSEFMYVEPPGGFQISTGHVASLPLLGGEQVFPHRLDTVIVIVLANNVDPTKNKLMLHNIIIKYFIFFYHFY